jgi:hypothetical protein
MGGLTIRAGQINDTGRIMVGGKGAWLIDHRLYVGGGGYGVTQPISVNNTDYEIGFGGVMLGYLFLPHKLVHFGTELMVGGGGIGEGWDDDNHRHGRGDAVFYAEPSLYASLNIAPYAKLNAGISYRYVQGSNTSGISDSDLRGVNAEISVLFGKF